MRNCAAFVVSAWLVPALFAAACGDHPAPSPNPPTSPPVDGIPVRGTERLGWVQQANTLAILRDSRFMIFIDGERSPLSNAACGETLGAQGYECAAPLPPLTPGRHVLELATTSHASGLESGRSAPLVVFRQPALTAAADTEEAMASRSSSGRLCAGTGAGATCYSVETILARIPAPRRVLALPDGRTLLVSDTRAEILHERTLELAVDAAEYTPRPAAFVDAAIDPAFATTHLVYFAIVFPDDDGGRDLSIVRGREVAHRIGELAAVVTGLPLASAGEVAIAVGIDGHIYVAMPAHGAGPRGVYDGSLLRFAADGAAAGDERTGAPILATGVDAPGALAAAHDGAIWLGSADDLTHATLTLLPQPGKHSSSPSPRTAIAMTPTTVPRGGVMGVAFGATSTPGGNRAVYVVSGKPRELFVGTTSRDATRIDALQRLSIGSYVPLAIATTTSDDVLIAATHMSDRSGSTAALLRLSPLRDIQPGR